MIKYFFGLILRVIFLTSILFINLNAQTISKETSQKFKAVSVFDGDKALLTIYETPDGKSVDEQAIRFKSVEEAKKKVEQLTLEANDVLEIRTSFRKAEKETLAYYLLLFEDAKNKTSYYKIVILSNDLIAITTATTKEVLLEFQNWKITQK